MPVKFPDGVSEEKRGTGGVVKARLHATPECTGMFVASHDGDDKRLASPERRQLTVHLQEDRNNPMVNVCRKDSGGSDVSQFRYRMLFLWHNRCVRKVLRATVSKILE